jgi:hypothetical protein
MLWVGNLQEWSVKIISQWHTNRIMNKLLHGWDFRFPRRLVWRLLSSGVLRRVSGRSLPTFRRCFLFASSGRHNISERPLNLRQITLRCIAEDSHFLASLRNFQHKSVWCSFNEYESRWITHHQKLRTLLNADVLIIRSWILKKENPHSAVAVGYSCVYTWL